MSGANGELRLSPFQAAFLAIVYGEGSIARPRIAELLWGTTCDAKARHRIRQLRHSVRTRLGRNLLVAEGDLLAPDPQIESDGRSFQEGLAAERLLEAATLLARGFLTSSAGELSDAFEDWRSSTERDLQRRVQQAAAAKWEASKRMDDWVRARDAAEATYLLDPRDEEMIARVIEARARVGKIHAAEVAYAEYGVTADGEPSDVIERLIKRVRSLRGTAAEHVRDAVVPFVGRRNELAALKKAFARFEQGGTCYVLITGEPGIGKSRLLAEARSHAHLAGVRCLTARAVELEQRISLNPVLDALEDVDIDAHLTSLGEPWRTVVGSTLPPDTLSGPVGAPPPIEDRSLPRRLLDAFSLLFRSLAEEQPTILFLDDIQWADATSVALLTFFQRRWADVPFGVVATARSDQLGPRDPTQSMFESASPVESGTVEVRDFDEREARLLLEHIGEGEIEEEALDGLIDLSGLHPLYLTEVTRDFLAGKLELPKRTSPEEMSVPISIRQILGARIDRLSKDATTLCHVLAAASKALRLSDLADIMGRSLDEVADAAEELRTQRLVELDRDRVWILHELFRSGIYGRVSEARRAVLHRRIAEFIERGSPTDSPGELAIHFDRAGESALATRYGWMAGSRTMEQGAMAEAAQFYELVTRNEFDEFDRAEATARMATALHLHRDVARANPALELASTRLRAAGLEEGARRMDVRRVEVLAEAGGTSIPDLVERLESIKGDARGERDWEAVALVLDVELQLLLLSEDLSGARKVTEQLEALASRQSPRVVAIANLALAVGLHLDNPTGALQAARIAVGITETRADDQHLKALNRLLMVCLHQGLLGLPENAGLGGEAQRLAAKSGDLLLRFSVESNLGVSHLDAGRLEAAEVHFDRAEKMMGTADMSFPRINLACNKGELALARNDFAAARSAYTLAGEVSGLAIPLYARQTVRAGLGLCALENGGFAEARRMEQEAGPPPPVWYYDPLIYVSFKARLLERRGEFDMAIAIVEDACTAVEGRLVMAWLKLRLLLIRLMIKTKSPRAPHVIEEAYKLCVGRALDTRAAELQALRERFLRQCR